MKEAEKSLVFKALVSSMFYFSFPTVKEGRVIASRFKHGAYLYTARWAVCVSILPWERTYVLCILEYQ